MLTESEEFYKLAAASSDNDRRPLHATRNSLYRSANISQRKLTVSQAVWMFRPEQFFFLQHSSVSSLCPQTTHGCVYRSTQQSSLTKPVWP